MNKSLETVQLRALAKVANQHYSNVRSSFQSTVESAQLCGKALNEAKDLIPFGGWLDWLSKNCPDITARTAQNWMKNAKCEIVSYLTSAKNLTQICEASGLLPEKNITPKPVVSATDEEKAVADRYCRSLGIGSAAAQETPAPVFPVEQVPAFVSAFAILPPSPPEPKLQDPSPGAPLGTGRSGGEDISKHPLGLMVEELMEAITRLGESHTVSNLLVLSPIFQYGRCHGVDGV